VDLYECQPEELPRIIFRDTPGYGTVADKGDPFSQLSREIQECDLLLMVCTTGSAARKADRELLQKIHEFYQHHPKRILPPIVHVLTHIDRIPAHLTTEAADAVAADYGLAKEQITVVCAEWGRLANVEDVVAAIREKLPDAERLKCSRCIRQIRQEQDEEKIFRQIYQGLRLTGGWIAGKA
jgi:GTPase Era involved in 16S rRNA processing